MEIKKNGFYLVKKEFFEKINDSSLPFQKNGRPLFYCIQDKKNKDILWLIPMTSKLEKVKKIIEKSGGEDKCKSYVINSTVKNSAFNIQDIFPIKVNYIDREFEKNGRHYILKNTKIIKQVEKKARKIIRVKMIKKNLVKNEIDVQKIYKILIEEIENKKRKSIIIPKKLKSKNKQNER
ncbi:MAG: hypothetical protein KGV57_03550 [Fusobacterium sp.]|nr:hypothetical protein [Fusobacterium sp.]